MTTYHFQCGPCYRCLYPRPPPLESVTNCADGGVVGPVCGVIGSLQALEVINIIARDVAPHSGKLFIFAGNTGLTKSVQLRERSNDCAVCGDTPTVTELMDYIQFCGSGPNDGPRHLDLLPSKFRKSVHWLKEMKGKKEILLIDTRPELEYQICNLEKEFPNCVNYPLDSMLGNFAILSDIYRRKVDTCAFICRRGNSSQEAVEAIQLWAKKDMSQKKEKEDKWVDIEGGLTAWQREIDPTFPIY